MSAWINIGPEHVYIMLIWYLYILYLTGRSWEGRRRTKLQNKGPPSFFLFVFMNYLDHELIPERCFVSQFGVKTIVLCFCLFFGLNGDYNLLNSTIGQSARRNSILIYEGGRRGGFYAPLNNEQWNYSSLTPHPLQ